MAILAFAHKHEAVGMSWPQIIGLLAGVGFDKCPDKLTLKRWFKRVEGIDPANWAPALAPDWKGNTAKLDVSPEAWSEFEMRIGLSGRNGTGANFHLQWKKVAADAAKHGWAWPSYKTVMRRWKDMDVARQRTLTLGEDAAAKSLIMYQHRSLEGMKAMQQVELDGRQFKVLVRFNDGKVGCPWVIVYTDRASSRVVGWAVSDSENEEAAAQATIHMCETNGIPDKMVTDNGSALNSRRMMGGLKPMFRRKQMKAKDWEAPGVLKIYGIEASNTGVGKARSKLSESIYSVLRHTDNDPVLFGAQRPGPNDGPNPDPVPLPEDLFVAFVNQTIAAFNADKKNRAQGLRKGESRDVGFARLSEGRIARHASPLQRRGVRMKWHPKTVMQDGRIKFDHGLWGDETTQAAMLHHVGRKVLIGIDPNYYHAPAMVRGWEEAHLRGRILLESLPVFEPAKHADEASRRRAVAEERHGKKLAATHRLSGVDTWVAEKRAEVMANAGLAPLPATPKVVQLDARGPFSPAAALYQKPELSQGAQLLALLRAEEDDRNRAASGGNR